MKKNLFALMMAFFFVTAMSTAESRCVERSCAKKIERPICRPHVRCRPCRRCPPPYPIYQRTDHWHS